MPQPANNEDARVNAQTLYAMLAYQMQATSVSLVAEVPLLERVPQERARVFCFHVFACKCVRTGSARAATSGAAFARTSVELPLPLENHLCARISVVSARVFGLTAHRLRSQHVPQDRGCCCGVFVCAYVLCGRGFCRVSTPDQSIPWWGRAVPRPGHADLAGAHHIQLL